MKKSQLIFLLLILSFVTEVNSQEPEEDTEDYLEFNDRRNVVHGVYLGLDFGYGEINGKNTYVVGGKIAYVANQRFEVGLAGKFLYSEQNVFNPESAVNEDLIGGYGGLHLEPILFNKSRVNLSFPLFIGIGGVGYVDKNAIRREEDIDLDEEQSSVLFILEPGVSALFNISRFLQLEAGVKYRLSNKIEIFESPVYRINGFTAGIGAKVGIFNMGRNRYKKKIEDEK